MGSMGMLLYHVDAFTAEPFAGNPAAVCLLDGARDASWMQAVAREMNLSETAFVSARGGADFDLRWFTPAAEVELCGHATLASAHVLWETGRLANGSTARFHTASGLLTAARAGPWIEMDFPSNPAEPVEAPEGLIRALGPGPEWIDPEWIGRSRFDHLVVVRSEAAVRALRPDFRALAAVETRGVIVTSRASQGCDFVSRFFAPRVGVDEDPVTGSAHCSLAPYWCEQLGRDSLLGYQCSARGGYVRVRLAGDRVLLGGQAVTVSKGELV